ncbi:hypothetical protein M2336_003625 [Sphingobium sp. B1D7B]|uniref:DUF1173 domain-containing protein n=1 Tax=Sphingobium sp. B1D7B TaxID=2940578 RepID=UPI002224EB92|nr:DUF1173 domain-containing protein [Sphingobium sp. B1D7B]MCW2406941.1 hypothetical protein [Sphingobium sp. B1D7B]
MQRYSILGQIIDADDPGFEPLLARAYSLKDRPLCLCRPDDSLPLYIAVRNGSYLLARWPHSGPRHAPWCDHYEAPDSLTGLGQVKGSAVVENEETGETSLRLAFPLSRGAARAAPSSFTNDKPTIKSNGQRLSIRGTLHYLWDRAQLTHWHPKMADKRYWGLIRRELLQAAHGCKARGANLSEVLFIPEPFRLDAKDEIAKRRRSELGHAYASRDNLMIMIGEVKAFDRDRFGERLIVKHLPDWPFLLDDDMARRVHRRFAAEEELWRLHGEDGHLVVAATFSISSAGAPHLHEISLMPVTKEWLPYETMMEQELISLAVRARRRFVKGMRVNLAEDKPVTSLMLTDTGAQATAVHLVHDLAGPRSDEDLALLMNAQGVAHVTWQSGMALPPASHRHDRPDGPGSLH